MRILILKNVGRAGLRLCPFRFGLNTGMSSYFTLDELTRSQTASRKGISNKPTEKVIQNLNALVEHILHPLRVHFDAPISISSGYRSLALNRAIGGSSSSQHVLGQAADISVSGHSDIEVVEWIAANLPFDQCILEFPPHGWVHVSYGPRMRKQKLTAKRIRGRVQYLAGFQ